LVDKEKRMKTWFITGINRGLGRSLAEALLAQGDRVVGTARKLSEVDDLKGDRLWTANLDLTDAEAIPAVVDRAFADLGRIDVVVNNAGYSLAGAAEECSLGMIRHQFEANVFGSIAVVKAALPHLRAQGGGRILQVVSAAGQLGFPGLSFYVASKWAVEGFIESLALEVAPFGIEATLFEPGAIRTDFGNTGVLPPAHPAYAGTPAALVREAAEALRNAGPGSSLAGGNPEKMAQVMIDSVAQTPAPKRVVMGGDVYGVLLDAYRDRAAALEAQREIAYSTDFQR
jgi:NAD(P)-dependent dehydrogenase (short-subunit alcohol dehydrogenase family)